MTYNPQTTIAALHELTVESAVNENGEPFVIVRAKYQPAEGPPVIIVGQTNPGLARAQGLAFLEAAEAAEGDAALFEVARYTSPDDPDEALRRAGYMLQALRNVRAGHQPDEDGE